jgi:sugar-specific transcriptional regulator TrmB
MLSDPVSVESLKSSIDSMKNTLNSSILSLKEEVSKLNDFNARQSKNLKFQCEISNAAINCFRFYDDTEGEILDSTKFVQSILLSFKRDLAHRIPDRDVHLFQKQDFRDKIAKQIFELIGQEPQYLLDDQVTIYYS